MSKPTAPKKGHKWKTVLMIAAPLIIGVAVIWYVNRKPKKLDPAVPDAIPNSQAAQPVRATSNADFPVRQGSDSALVKQLQNALIAAYGASILPKYGADGDFGPETAAALKSKLGITSIASQADYDAALARIQSSQQIASALSRGKDLVARWKASTSLQLMASKDTMAYGVAMDTYGALNPTGKNFTLKSGLKFNRTDYILTDTTKNGFVLFTVTRGALAGTYKADAIALTLG